MKTKNAAMRVLPNGTRIRGNPLPPGTVALLVKLKTDRAAAAPSTWKELHARYLNWKGVRDFQWLMADFIPRISNTANCRCRANFRQWVFDHNVDWNDPFTWSVEAHNAVNVRLGKPTLTVAEARAAAAGSSASQRF